MSDPEFSAEAQYLMSCLADLNREELGTLLKASDKIIDDTEQLINDFNQGKSPKNGALFSYCGTVFKHIDPFQFSKSDLKYASERLRILSGLYGVLRPTDCISPYRLEMKTPLKTDISQNLNQFWKEKITDHLVKQNQNLVNLASDEYSKVIDFKKMTKPVISINFKEEDSGRYRTIGTYNKMARGFLIGQMIREKVSDLVEIQNWNIKGYSFNKKLSSENKWFFTGKWIM